MTNTDFHILMPLVLFLPSSTHYQSAQRVETALRLSSGPRLLVCTFFPGSPRVSAALCRWSMVSLSTVSWEKVTPIPCRQVRNRCQCRLSQRKIELRSKMESMSREVHLGTNCPVLKKKVWLRFDFFISSHLPHSLFLHSSPQPTITSNPKQQSNVTQEQKENVALCHIMRLE